MSTIFKFYAKLIKYNIIYISYLKEVNKYINKNKSNKFIVDTTFINNKLGIDFIGSLRRANYLRNIFLERTLQLFKKYIFRKNLPPHYVGRII